MRVDKRQFDWTPPLHGGSAGGAGRDASRGQRPRAGHVRHARSRRGFTLFEVLVALTIFVGSIAAISQLISSGVRGALRARLQTQAVQRSVSKMSEITAGFQPMQQTGQMAFPDDPAWHWSLSVSQGAHPDLFLVEVTSTHGTQGSMGEVSFTLRRLVRNPQLALDAMIKEQQEAAAAAAAASANATTTGSTP